jgi:type I restriction enzyme S subunit
MEEGRELPVGWKIARLEEIGAWGSGGTPKRTNQNFYTNGTIPWLVIGDLNDGLVTAAASSITEEALGSSAAKIVPRDSLLVAMYGSIGKLGITGVDCATNQAIAHCKPFRELIELQYLFNALMHVKEDLISKGQGGAQLNISQGILRDQEIPLAPINEQRRIAAKLDTTLAAVDACRQRLDGVEALLKRFRQAVLAAATSGELTREWREERGIADEWNAAQLGPLLNDMRYGTAKKCSYEAVGLPVLRIPNILESGCICQADLKYADFDAQEVAKLSLLPGDLLVIRSNGSLDLVGRVAEASEKDAGMLFAGYLIRLRPNQDKILSPYLQLALRSPSTRSTIELAARSTSGVNNINSQFLSSLAIQMPAIPEQQEIVRRTQSLFSLADQLEARLTSARRIVERLTPALLAKAFRGELVPQDPNDEPASELLARIRAARQAEAAASGPSRRGRRQAAANPVPSPAEAAPVTPDRLANLLRECGALSERALLAASELDPASFQAQLLHERSLGAIGNVDDDGLELLDAVG